MDAFRFPVAHMRVRLQRLESPRDSLAAAVIEFHERFKSEGQVLTFLKDSIG